jgi:hypothetical protein
MFKISLLLCSAPAFAALAVTSSRATSSSFRASCASDERARSMSFFGGGSNIVCSQTEAKRDALNTVRQARCGLRNKGLYREQNADGYTRTNSKYYS